MKDVSEKKFKHNYQSHLKHLKLKGLQPKTIEAQRLFMVTHTLQLPGLLFYRLWPWSATR